jgi:nucleotidyltransferase substrate binding protein (TIGR01987 family)
MALDLTPLAKALDRLREGLARHRAEPLDEQLRDGLIQRFEFTYELSHKLLRRHLVDTAASPEEIDSLPFADLIRAGNKEGLVRAAWPAWRRFREIRTRTGHTYDAATAALVVAEIPSFLAEAEYLLAELQKRSR